MKRCDSTVRVRGEGRLRCIHPRGHAADGRHLFAFHGAHAAGGRVVAWADGWDRPLSRLQGAILASVDRGERVTVATIQTRVGGGGVSDGRIRYALAGLAELGLVERVDHYTWTRKGAA